MNTNWGGMASLLGANLLQGVASKVEKKDIKKKKKKAPGFRDVLTAALSPNPMYSVLGGLSSATNPLTSLSLFGNNRKRSPLSIHQNKKK